MSGMPEPKRAPAPEPEQNSIVTKLAQLVRFTEQVQPDRAADGANAILQIAQLAHTLVEEISKHLKEQNRRIADLENLATTRRADKSSQPPRF
jgi:ABC-type transporter Mla subunit MlaD